MYVLSLSLSRSLLLVLTLSLVGAYLWFLPRFCWKPVYNRQTDPLSVFWNKSDLSPAFHDQETAHWGPGIAIGRFGLRSRTSHQLVHKTSKMEERTEVHTRFMSVI